MKYKHNYIPKAKKRQRLMDGKAFEKGGDFKLSFRGTAGFPQVEGRRTEISGSQRTEYERSTEMEQEWT